MYRPVGGLLAIVILSSCAPTDLASLQQDLTLVAQEQLKKTLASHLTGELGKGVDVVISSLAKPGGFLDDPLVRILLPPPLGLALGVAQDLRTDPQATLLEVVINQAAEQAIPGAAPILQAALAQITPDEARKLLDGDSTAATEYLKSKTAEALHRALTPSIATTLASSGAQLIYAELTDSYAAQTDLPLSEVETTGVTASHLKDYVAEQAVDGLFKALGVQEKNIRENLDQSMGGLLQGMERAPVVEPPVNKQQ